MKPSTLLFSLLFTLTNLYGQGAALAEEQSKLYAGFAISGDMTCPEIG